MAQAYSKLKKNLMSYGNFLQITAMSSCQCTANKRPKNVLKSSVSLSFTCDITPSLSWFDQLD